MPDHRLRLIWCKVCESTEIIYDKNVVNFPGKDKHCARRLQEVCTRLSLVYFLALISSGALGGDVFNGYERKWNELVQNATMTGQRPGLTTAQAARCVHGPRPTQDQQKRSCTKAVSISGRASGQHSFAALRRTAALDRSQQITHLFSNLEGGLSISLAVARVKRAGDNWLIRRKNNSYFLGERKMTIIG
jgi:hypothetical protein